MKLKLLDFPHLFWCTTFPSSFSHFSCNLWPSSSEDPSVTYWLACGHPKWLCRAAASLPPSRFALVARPLMCVLNSTAPITDPPWSPQVTSLHTENHPLVACYILIVTWAHEDHPFYPYFLHQELFPHLSGSCVYSLSQTTPGHGPGASASNVCEAHESWLPWEKQRWLSSSTSRSVLCLLILHFINSSTSFPHRLKLTAGLPTAALRKP